MWLMYMYEFHVMWVTVWVMCFNVNDVYVMFVCVVIFVSVHVVQYLSVCVLVCVCRYVMLVCVCDMCDVVDMRISTCGCECICI